jgi:hypothetical protein
MQSAVHLLRSCPINYEYAELFMAAFLEYESEKRTRVAAEAEKVNNSQDQQNILKEDSTDEKHE